MPGDTSVSQRGDMASQDPAVLGLNSLLDLGPTERSNSHSSPHWPPTPFSPFAEIHLQLGSVILVFSTLGINRGCVAVLAFLMHWNEQTLKVRIAWSRLGLQLPPAGRVRAGPGRKAALTRRWEEKDLERELHVQCFTQHSTPKVKIPKV